MSSGKLILPGAEVIDNSIFDARALPILKNIGNYIDIRRN